MTREHITLDNVKYLGQCDGSITSPMPCTLAEARALTGSVAPAQEYTNYQFDCKPAALHGALERFAQFFIAPLCKEDALEREVMAVNNEFTGNHPLTCSRASVSFLISPRVLTPWHVLSKQYRGVSQQGCSFETSDLRCPKPSSCSDCTFQSATRSQVPVEGPLHDKECDHCAFEPKLSGGELQISPVGNQAYIAFSVY